MSVPKAPENFYITARGNFNILTWDKVTQDTDTPPNTIILNSYNVYRGTNPALTDLAIYNNITTTDFAGDVDHCFIDYEITPGIVYFYKITAIDSTMQEGNLSDEKANIYFVNSQDVNRPEEFPDSILSAMWDESDWDDCLFN